MGAAFAFQSAEGLEALRGQVRLVLGTLGTLSLHPKVAQPFSQRHVCHLLTLEPSRAQISTA